MADFVLAPDYTFESTKEYSTLISEFENGVEQRRARRSTQRRSWKLQFKNRDSTDLGTLTSRFDTSLGALTSFTWLNPIDNQTYTVRFKEDSLTYSTDAFGLYNIEFEITEIL